MTQIRTKQELLELFADNTEGLITAEALRDFVVSNLSYATVQAETSPFQIVEVVDTVICAAGSSVLRLPIADSFGDRVLNILNFRPNAAVTVTINPDAVGTDTINGNLTNIQIPEGENMRLVSSTEENNWLAESTPREPQVRHLRGMDTLRGQAGKIAVVNPEERGFMFLTLREILQLGLGE